MFTVLALYDCFDGGVDRVLLVVPGALTAAVFKTILQDNRFLVGSKSLPCFHVRYLDQRSLGEGNASREERGFSLHAHPGAVVKDEAVSVGGEHERDVEGHGIYPFPIQSLTADCPGPNCLKAQRYLWFRGANHQENSQSCPSVQKGYR
jgi:hypothetical protein